MSKTSENNKKPEPPKAPALKPRVATVSPELINLPPPQLLSRNTSGQVNVDLSNALTSVPSPNISSISTATVLGKQSHSNSK